MLVALARPCRAAFSSSLSWYSHAERLADVVDDVLIGRRVVAAGRFVAAEVGVLASRRRRRRRSMPATCRGARAGCSAHLGAAGAGGRAVAVHVERGGRRRDGLSSSVRRARSRRGALPAASALPSAALARGLAAAASARGFRGAGFCLAAPACGACLLRAFAGDASPPRFGRLAERGFGAPFGRSCAAPASSCGLPFGHRVCPFGTLTVWR